jgi:hypothetical protein
MASGSRFADEYQLIEKMLRDETHSFNVAPLTALQKLEAHWTGNSSSD